MILYDPGKWSIAFAFSLRGSTFPKAFAWACPCSLSAAALHTLFRTNEQVMHWVGAGDVAASVLGGFTFILGFLVVFRSQQAYSRWWEGGTLLQQLRGEWFNSYSCLIAFCNGSKEKQEEVHKFQHQLVRLYSLLYGCALQQVSTLQEKKFELIDIKGLNTKSLKFLQDSPDRCEVVLQWIQRLIVESDAEGILKIAPPILSRVFNELGNGIVNLNNARKITEFPIPFPLAQMITVMLLFHAIVTPVICAATVETVYWCATITLVVTFSYWSINYIAVELEMPFGDDLNDLPLYDMQRDMNGSLCTLIEERAQRVPNFDFNQKEHEKLTLRILDFDSDFVQCDSNDGSDSRQISPADFSTTSNWAQNLPPESQPPNTCADCQPTNGDLRDTPTPKPSIPFVSADASCVASPDAFATMLAEDLVVTRLVVPGERGISAGSSEDGTRRGTPNGLSTTLAEAAASSVGTKRLLGQDHDRRTLDAAHLDAMGEDWRIANELETIESARSNPSSNAALPTHDGGTTEAAGSQLATSRGSEPLDAPHAPRLHKC